MLFTIKMRKKVERERQPALFGLAHGPRVVKRATRLAASSCDPGLSPLLMFMSVMLQILDPLSMHTEFSLRSKITAGAMEPLQNLSAVVPINGGDT
jgi:hypothetical protein